MTKHYLKIKNKHYSMYQHQLVNLQVLHEHKTMIQSKSQDELSDLVEKYDTYKTQPLKKKVSLAK